MNTIDRYMLRQFLKTFAICFLTLTGLYVIFDFFTNFEELLRYSNKTDSLALFLLQYYGCRVVDFFNRTSALLTLVSAMFTVAWIQRYNELTALLAAGISRVRVIKPIIAASIAVSLGAVGIREGVIPRLQTQLSRSSRDLAGEVAQKLRPRYDAETDILMRGDSTFANVQRIVHPRFQLPPRLSAHGNRLEAAEAFYRPPQADRPGGYLLRAVTRPENVDARASVALDGRTVIFTRRDHPDWLQAGECFVASGVTFEQLAAGQTYRQFASTWQLIAGLRNRSLDYGADVRVAIHARLVQPVLDITMLFLGLPLVLSRQSRNVFLAIGLCLGLVTCLLIVAIAFQQLGTAMILSPALAAWGPLFLFVPTAVGLSQAMWE